MDPPHLGVWNGVYHGIPALDWDDLQGCPVMVYWDVSWLVWPFWFDRIKVAIGGSWFSSIMSYSSNTSDFSDLTCEQMVSWVTIDPPYFIYFQSNMSMYGTEEL